MIEEHRNALAKAVREFNACVGNALKDGIGVNLYTISYTENDVSTKLLFDVNLSPSRRSRL
jgi:hypothetical protein